MVGRPSQKLDLAIELGPMSRILGESKDEFTVNQVRTRAPTFTEENCRLHEQTGDFGFDMAPIGFHRWSGSFGDLTHANPPRLTGSGVGTRTAPGVPR